MVFGNSINGKTIKVRKRLKQMSLFDDFIQETNKDVLKKVEDLIEEKGIRQKAEQETQELARKTAFSLINPEKQEAPNFKGINFSEEDPDQYLLILDYFESTGMKFTSQTIRYESQNPGMMLNRKALAEKYGLRSYDKTPLLVQMIEQRLKIIGNE